ncbi:hypothetical protein H6G81_04725 [Scytonema hofmannii FACHB-248]|uniref:Uncharacterized protein n=1 Tax=Scytonema hofmannii FACHB-248 TaxID=1842502 RepID=A0ABR8GKZ1_9CYAN|nr:MULTISPECIES: hypothetical protein [Nostocales]MBD2603854.1 hypothetical protein [Scytonema hofmannii FACHB-248]
MSTTSIIHPLHFQIIQRIGTTWYFKYGSVFYNRTDKSLPESNRERLFGITKNKIVIELFRINGGNSGYYLANLRDKKYYYCGDNWEDIKAKLQELGIGTDEPNNYSVQYFAPQLLL